ncbi:lexapeptide family class V lantibiotic [Streptomyces sp. NPDC090445]|uniref:lexapeptide family class V lantibiotic n=1 Tax=Streptomyces sp. NPDC090445 TaxID=3365963 RepID=UPI0037FF6678
MLHDVTEKDLFDGYTAYTSAEELGLHDGATAGPAFSPTVPWAIQAGMISARSSQACAAALGSLAARTVENKC